MNRNTRNAFIRQMLQNETSIEPSPEFSYNALIKSRQDYDAMYSRSIADPEAFWADMATEHLDWFKPWDAVEEYDFDSDEPFVRYFRGGELNASCNCIDRHLNGPRRNKAALIWQGEPTEEVDVYTYQRLHREVCKAANMLRRLGVRKGDRVVLYMPMVPQLAISMLACARIGAIHCVVFSGLSAESLKDRIVDSGATVVITSNYGYRSGKILRLKEICDKALDMCPQVESCVVVRRIEKRTAMKAGRDFWWDDVLAPEAPQCEPERMEANDPLFILYTSGSTAKPKGILHGTGGYLLYATLTSKAWMWYYSTVGHGMCPIVDTWWQTETGGIMITSIPGAVDMKPGSAALPFFGIEPRVIGADGAEADAGERGSLVLTRPWPGMMLGVYGNAKAHKDVYFPTPGYYLTGDGAYRDEDGYFWITGRIDDVMNVSGHRIGTAEVESALVSYSQVAEAAVVGYPHPVKGEGIYAYITVKEGTVIDADLRDRLFVHVRESIGPIATPDVIHFANALPKTRSGKIMRRILRKIAAQETEDLCDISTLSEPSVVHELIQETKRMSA